MSSESAKAAARRYYHRVVADPEKRAARDQTRKRWWAQNVGEQRRKQRDKKRARKQWAIEYLGGACKKCLQSFHPAVFEFHHRNPEEKDRDPSKMMQLSIEKLKTELDKCDLLCANCHRLEHHEEGWLV